MNVEEIREYCLSKKGVEESFPFDETTLVMKVLGKIFIFIPLERSHSISLKFPPEDVEDLRDRYPEVTSAYHLSKKHWNALSLDGALSPKQIKDWIDQSYYLVVSKLPKKYKETLNE